MDLSPSHDPNQMEFDFTDDGIPTERSERLRLGKEMTEVRNLPPVFNSQIPEMIANTFYPTETLRKLSRQFLRVGARWGYGPKDRESGSYHPVEYSNPHPTINLRMTVDPNIRTRRDEADIQRTLTHELAHAADPEAQEPFGYAPMIEGFAVGVQTRHYGAGNFRSAYEKPGAWQGREQQHYEDAKADGIAGGRGQDPERKAARERFNQEWQAHQDGQLTLWDRVDGRDGPENKGYNGEVV